MCICATYKTLFLNGKKTMENNLYFDFHIPCPCFSESVEVLLLIIISTSWLYESLEMMSYIGKS